VELSFGELLLVAAIAFLVLGPTEMVRRAQQLGRFIGRMRTEFNNLRILTEEQILKGAELKNQILDSKTLDPYRDLSHRLRKERVEISGPTKKDSNDNS
jgi:Sec-independent protein translocase protein TatA